MSLLCSTCKHYVGTDDINGSCARYPKWINVQQSHFCGEHKNIVKNVQKLKIRVDYPTYQEFFDFCKENGYTSISKKAYDYYSSANWHDSTGKKICSWKQKLIAVWFRPENHDDNNKQIGSNRNNEENEKLASIIKENEKKKIDELNRKAEIANCDENLEMIEKVLAKKFSI